jgi:tetratricopeptide (TPR) repeat protein
MPFFGTTTLADVVGNLAATGPLPLWGKHFVTTLNSRKKVWKSLSTPTDQALSASSISPSEPATNTAPGLAEIGRQPVSRKERNSALHNLDGRTYVNAVLWIGARLADGLDHAHQRGILHRDLKPANVLLTDDGQPMLLDFNLSEDMKLRSSASAARAGGTLPYMSPEQMESFRTGQALDERSDLYSLGLILYELLAGKHAFPCHTGPAAEVVSKYLDDRRTQRPSLRSHNVRVSPAAEAIVLHCLEPVQDRRYQSARELQEDIERHLADLPLKYATEPSLRERASKWRRRHPRLTSSTSVAAFFGAVFLIFVALLTVRMQRVRQLEAQNNLAGFREQAQTAKFLLNKSAPDGKLLEEGVRLCSDALGRYRVLEGASLDELPAARDLPETDRNALRNEIEDVLLTLARATALQSKQEQEPERRQQKAEFGLQVVDLAKARTREAGGSKVALLQSAELNGLLGRREEERREEKLAEGLTPTSANELYLLALNLGDRREFKRALPLLQESTRRNPRDVWAWFYQGYCHQQLGEFSDAIRSFTVSLALAPRHTSSYLPIFNRGLCYAKLGLWLEACGDLDESIRLRPESAEAYLDRGIVRLECGKHAAAIADFDEALRLDPAVTRVYFLRSRARNAAGDSEGARQDRARALQQEPSDEMSWIDRAIERFDTEPAAALTDLDQALKLNPYSLLAMQNKAHLLGERLGRQEDAVAVLNREIELYPGYVRGRAGRGVHLARLGRRAEAHADAREALARSDLGETHYQASNIYALTSRQYPEDALEAYPLLARALQQGFGLDILDKDSDFDPIRDQPEFQRVVKAARELDAAIRKGSRQEGGRP